MGGGNGSGLEYPVFGPRLPLLLPSHFRGSWISVACFLRHLSCCRSYTKPNRLAAKLTTDTTQTKSNLNNFFKSKYKIESI